MELVLNTYGSALMKENEAFAVVSKEGKQIIPPDKLRSIQIGRGTKLTSDAAMLALKEVNELYTNHDSIYLVPVSSDEIKATRVIGGGFDAELFTNPPGTLII